MATKGHIHRMVELLGYQVKDSKKRLDNCQKAINTAAFNTCHDTKVLACVGDIVKYGKQLSDSVSAQVGHYDNCMEYLNGLTEGSDLAIEYHPELKQSINDFTKECRKTVRCEKRVTQAEEMRKRFEYEYNARRNAAMAA